MATTPFSIRLETGLRLEIGDLAKAESRSMSSMIVVLLNEALKVRFHRDVVMAEYDEEPPGSPWANRRREVRPDPKKKG